MKAILLIGATNFYRDKLLLFLLLVSPFVLLVSCVSRKTVTATGSVKTPVSQHKTDSTLGRESAAIPGDFADPSVIRKDDVYFATGTSSEWAPHFPLYQSSDLLHWQPIRYVFSKTPTWAGASFWAPELFYRNGTYFVYYVARKKSDGISCIGVATTNDPAKGFTDRGILLEFGKEAIDPFVVEDNGNLYITWKAYGLDKRPIELLGSRLTDDGLKVVGEPFFLLRDDDRKGLEGQCLVKRKGYYYLFYSIGNCCGSGCSYQVEVARSPSLQGPYTRYAKNPVLAESRDWKCSGHGTIVTSKEGRDFYLYHAYSKEDNVYTGRQGLLGEIRWDAETGWPRVELVTEAVAKANVFRDDFSNPVLSAAWQWDFRHTNPSVKVKKNILRLSGQPTADNQTGTAMTVRPVAGNYEVTTEVTGQNGSLKGLVLYGDAAQSVGIGVQDNIVQVWEVKKDKRSIVKEQQINANKPVQLKMQVQRGYQCRFYWSENGNDWNEVVTNDTFYNADFSSTLGPESKARFTAIWRRTCFFQLF